MGPDVAHLGVKTSLRKGWMMHQGPDYRMGHHFSKITETAHFSGWVFTTNKSQSGGNITRR